ncbi:MAG: alpha-amylase family glycosyl hydrolase, partial [Gaiellaceae bacterium]
IETRSAPATVEDVELSEQRTRLRREGTPLAGRLGAVPRPGGLTDFRVWAPGAASVAVETASGSGPLSAAEDGMFTGTLLAGPGDDYLLSVDGGRPLPDPCSRWQPNGLRGPSRVLDTSDFTWSAECVPLRLDELVIYELHVGAFTGEGTFAAATARLGDLAELGVTAVELLPVATFPGTRGWGYDGVLNWAPHHAYGGPHALAGFVDAAHAAGLGVILDVVYNHIGPAGDLVSWFEPYFADAPSTGWGDALDFRARGVREWAIQNAELWIRDYRVDGLRLDAIHAIDDEQSPVHVLAELRDRVKVLNPQALVISETGTEDLRPLEEWGHDAIWLDAVHHHLHVLLTGEHDGYYEGFGDVGRLLRELTKERPERFVVGAQNHDQVGNRAFGDRLAPADHRVALAVVLFAPLTPLLFMGEEYDETRPFGFFADHDDPATGAAAAEGRRREFAAFASFAGDDLPDPQAEETFLRSKLAPHPADPLYRELIALRRELPKSLSVEQRGRRLLLRRGTVTLSVDLAATTVELAY